MGASSPVCGRGGGDSAGHCRVIGPRLPDAPPFPMPCPSGTPGLPPFSRRVLSCPIPGICGARVSSGGHTSPFGEKRVGRRADPAVDGFCFAYFPVFSSPTQTFPRIPRQVGVASSALDSSQASCPRYARKAVRANDASLLDRISEVPAAVSGRLQQHWAVNVSGITSAEYPPPPWGGNGYG